MIESTVPTAVRASFLADAASIAIGMRLRSNTALRFTTAPVPSSFLSQPKGSHPYGHIAGRGTSALPHMVIRRLQHGSEMKPSAATLWTLERCEGNPHCR
jgi:hypothetical protein